MQEPLDRFSQNSHERWHRKKLLKFTGDLLHMRVGHKVRFRLCPYLLLYYVTVLRYTLKVSRLYGMVKFRPYGRDAES